MRSSCSRNHFRLSQLAVIGFSLYYSCTPPSIVGADLFTEESFNITIVDTASIRVSTILLDSLDTYSPDRLLLGFHQDELLGKVLAAPFFEIGLDLGQETPDQNTTVFDSLTLVLEYDGYSMYDTINLQTVYVHRLQESMELNDEGGLNNSSFFRYRDLPAGQLRFRPKPQGNNATLEIRLSDTFGQELFRKARENDDDLANDEDFKAYFNGLVVLPDTTENGAILGFSPTPQLRLYYKDISALPVVQRQLTFSCDPESGEDVFNRIQSDRNNTLLAALQVGPNTTLDSRKSENMAFVQGGTGILTRIELPYLRSLLELNESLIIAAAQLKIQPILSEFSEQFELPETLEVYWVDKDNVVTAQNTFPASLATDPEFGRDVYYTVDIQNFIEQQLRIETNNENALLLSFQDPDYNNSVGKVIFGNDRHASAPMELKITLLDIKK